MRSKRACKLSQLMIRVVRTPQTFSIRWPLHHVAPRPGCRSIGKSTRRLALSILGLARCKGARTALTCCHISRFFFVPESRSRKIMRHRYLSYEPREMPFLAAFHVERDCCSQRTCQRSSTTLNHQAEVTPFRFQMKLSCTVIVA